MTRKREVPASCFGATPLRRTHTVRGGGWGGGKNVSPRVSVCVVGVAVNW